MKKQHPLLKLIYVTASIGFLGMVIINTSYKIIGPPWLASEWTAGYMLAYWGTLLSSITAIYGLYLTFIDNKKGITEQSRLGVLPIIGISRLNQDYKIPAYEAPGEYKVKTNIPTGHSSSEKSKYYFWETKSVAIYCIIKDGEIHYTWKLPKRELDLVKNLGREKVECKEGYKIVDNKIVYLSLEIKNIGNGPATNMQIGINRIENNGNFEYAQSLNLSRDEKINLSIYSENRNYNNCGEYELSIYYDDIYGNGYRQIHPLIIEPNINEKVIYNFDLGIKQESYKRRKNNYTML